VIYARHINWAISNILNTISKAIFLNGRKMKDLLILRLRFLFLKIILFLSKLLRDVTFKSNPNHFLTVSKIHTIPVLENVQINREVKDFPRHWFSILSNEFNPLNYNSLDRGELSLQPLPEKNFSLTIFEVCRKMKTYLLKDKKILLKTIILILLLSCYIFPQSSTFSGTGNWNDATRWSAGIPTATTNVILAAGSNCTVNIGDAVCATLTFNSGTAINLNINNWGQELTVSGNLTVNGTATIAPGILSRLIAGGTIIVNGSLMLNPAFWGIVEFHNGITNNGTFTGSGSGVYYFNTNNQLLNGNPITLSGTFGTTTIQGNITVTNNTALTILGALNGDAADSKFINGSNAILNITGAVMNTGKFDAASPANIVNYNGNNNQSIKDTTYFHLSIDGAGIKTIPLSTELFNIQGNLTIDSGATLNGNNRIINIKGNWINNGNYSNPNSVSFTGTLSQAIGGNVATAFDTLVINNSAGIALSANQTVNDLLILTNGNINTSSTNLLIVSASCTISGGSSTSFINGPLSKGKNTAAQQNLFYPIGKNSSYRPIELIITHSNTNLSNYTAEVFNTAPISRTLPGTLGSVSNVRYWNVAKTGSATTTSAYITLNYGVDDGVSDPQDLRIAKDNGSAWVDIGGTANGSPTGSILSSLFTSFSDFVLANAAGGSNPLPVELASFTASSRENDVILKWTTKIEMQNYGFEIERCVKPEGLSDEPNWVSIGFVNGSGNSNSPKEYSFVAKELFSDSYLFRLKQLDTDGSFQYSSEIEISIGSFPETFRLEQNYPNPFNPATTIKFAVNETSPVSVKVFDALGNELKTLFNETAENGKLYSVEFDGSDYASGVYYYSISGNNLHAVKKMLLIK